MQSFADEERNRTDEADGIAVSLQDGNVVLHTAGIAAEGDGAERFPAAWQGYDGADAADDKVPGAAGNIPVKFIKVIIVPDVAVDDIAEFVSVNAGVENVTVCRFNDDF